MYEPYKIDAMKDLMQIGYRLGWYGGTKTLFTITMLGAFEGWSGRASETWEQRFRITTQEIIEDGKMLHPKIEVEDDTLNGACLKAVKAITAALNPSEARA